MLKRTCAAHFIGLAAALLLTISATWADTLVQVTSQAAQGATDSISWKQLGVDQTILGASFSAKSASGVTSTVSLSGASSVVSLVCSPSPVNCSWTGGTGFGVGDGLIWTSDAGNGGNGPVTLKFSAPIAGAGALIQANTPGKFTAKIEAFNGATSLGFFTVASDTNGDAVYMGLSDQTGANITSVVFSLTSCVGNCTDFGIDTVFLNTKTGLAHTSTILASSVNPSVFGQGVTFTATVSSTSGTPTGTVTFKDGVTTLGTGALSSGKATLTTSALAVGSHSITAAYGGSASFAASTSSVLTQKVSVSATSTLLASSANPSVPGQSVTFTATVKPAFGGTPTGSVTFKNGSTVLGTVTLSSAKATFTTSTLTLGSHSITTAYGGSTNYTASTSATLTQTVGVSSTKTAVTSSANPSVSGQSVTFTATVTPAFGTTPTGKVTFKDGSTTLGTGTLSSGKATFTTSTLVLGSHSITAAYGGSTDDTGSTSLAVTQVVKASGTSTSVSSSLNPSTHGTTVTFTATVKPSFSGTPTGSVTFKDGSTTLRTATLSSGKATFATSTLAIGKHSITAVYGGSASYLGSTSPVLTQTVN